MHNITANSLHTHCICWIAARKANPALHDLDKTAWRIQKQRKCESDETIKGQGEGSDSASEAEREYNHRVQPSGRKPRPKEVSVGSMGEAVQTDSEVDGGCRIGSADRHAR